MKIDREYVIKTIRSISDGLSAGSGTESGAHFVPGTNAHLNWKGKLAQALPRMMQERTLDIYYKGRKAIEEEKRFLFPSREQKRWSIDFLSYCLENEVSIDLDMFPQDERKKVENFVRNKVKIALLNRIEKTEFFEKSDCEMIHAYSDFKKKFWTSKIWKKVNLASKEYQLILSEGEISILYHRYGVDEIPEKAKKRLVGKDFIDAGAYTGDSVAILEGLNPGRIIAFEPDMFNLKMLRATMKRNRMENVLVEQKGIGERDEMLAMSGSGLGAALSRVKGETDVVSVDSYVKKNNLDVGLIKADIEGFELELARGAKQTIIDRKPVLILALYHTGKDFFGVPNLLKELVPEYEFKLLDLNREEPIFEKFLLAYTQK